MQAVEQVAFADRILLNKVDLVSEDEKAELVKAIKVRQWTSKSRLPAKNSSVHMHYPPSMGMAYKYYIGVCQRMHVEKPASVCVC